MIENILTVGNQVLILFVLIAVGFICGKKKILNENSVRGMTDLVLYTVTQCVIINSFMREFDTAMLKNLIIAFIAASAPWAANTTMFAQKFDADVPLSAACVSLTTLLSVITMPVIVGIAAMLK